MRFCKEQEKWELAEVGDTKDTAKEEIKGKTMKPSEIRDTVNITLNKEYMKGA